jgi:hypothetical protein
MTDNNHPITPPSELVQQWLGNHFGTTVRGEVSDVELAIATQAARWGSDQELEACCEWFVRDWTDFETADTLRAARRPKPPSLKERALQALAHLENGAHCSMDTTEPAYYIRRALESLPD